MLSVGEGTHKIFMMPLMRKQIGKEFCWENDGNSLLTNKLSGVSQGKMNFSTPRIRAGDWQTGAFGKRVSPSGSRHKMKDAQAGSGAGRMFFFGGVISSFFYNCENGI